MKRIKMLVVCGLIMVGCFSVYGAGGVLPDGQGTNWSYGQLYGQGTYYLRDWATTNIDGSGITNISVTSIVGLEDSTNALNTRVIALEGATNDLAIRAVALEGATNALEVRVTAVEGATNDLAVRVLATEGATNDLAIRAVALEGATNNLQATKLDLAGGTMTGDINLGGQSITNGYFEGDGGGLTNVSATVAADSVTVAMLKDDVKAYFITTNDTDQSKAGKLTLNGGLEVGGLMTLKLGAVETIAEGAAVPATAANIKVIGDSAPVTATVADGATEGQVLTIRGTDDTDAVTLTNDAVLPNFRLGLRDVISFTWDGSQWVEVFRRDN